MASGCEVEEGVDEDSDGCARSRELDSNGCDSSTCTDVTEEEG